jgi:hypothetical protein
MKTCPQGHRYQDSENACPYCPPKGDSAQGEKTVIIESTEKLVTAGKPGGKPASGEKPAPRDGSGRETVIMNMQGKAVDKSETRRLVGWIITYTWNPAGDFYGIREGKTRIGSGAANDILIADSMVSSEHAQILYRDGNTRIKDAFSTNGTFVNGTDAGDESVVLKHGDKIILGRTEFLVCLVPEA